MQSFGGAHCPVPAHFKYSGVRATFQLCVDKQYVLDDYPPEVEVDEGRIPSAIVATRRWSWKMGASSLPGSSLGSSLL